MQSGGFIGPYRLEESIGDGSERTVWAARHPTSNRRVAIEIIPSDEPTDPEVREAFLREVQALSRLKGPQIVPVIDFGFTAAGQGYQVTALIEGEDLGARLRRGGAVPVVEAVEIGIAALEGIAEAHGVGVVHGGLTPGCVLLQADGTSVDGRSADGIGNRVKVLGFGVAKLAVGREESPHYKAPEQLQGGRITSATDIYAFGATLYHLVTGKPAFDGSREQVRGAQMEREAQSMIERAPASSIPMELDDIVLGCLEPDPALRPQSAAALVGRLQRLRAAMRVSAGAGAVVGGGGIGGRSDGGMVEIEAAGFEEGGFEAAGFEEGGFEAAGFEAAGFEGGGFEGGGFEGGGFEAAGFESAGFESAGFESAGFEAAGFEAAGFEAAGFKAAGFEAAGFEAAGFEAAGTEGAGIDRPGIEAPAIDRAGIESGAGAGSDDAFDWVDGDSLAAAGGSAAPSSGGAGRGAGAVVETGDSLELAFDPRSRTGATGRLPSTPPKAAGRGDRGDSSGRGDGSGRGDDTDRDDGTRRGDGTVRGEASDRGDGTSRSDDGEGLALAESGEGSAADAAASLHPSGGPSGARGEAVPWQVRYRTHLIAGGGVVAILALLWLVSGPSSDGAGAALAVDAGPPVVDAEPRRLDIGPTPQALDRGAGAAPAVVRGGVLSRRRRSAEVEPTVLVIPDRAPATFTRLDDGTVICTEAEECAVPIDVDVQVTKPGFRPLRLKGDDLYDRRGASWRVILRR